MALWFRFVRDEHWLEVVQTAAPDEWAARAAEEVWSAGGRTDDSGRRRLADQLTTVAREARSMEPAATLVLLPAPTGRASRPAGSTSSGPGAFFWVGSSSGPSANSGAASRARATTDH